MISQIFAIRDAKIESFSQPFLAPTKGYGVRMFGDEVARDGSDLKKHPDDFGLYHLGQFDDQTGQYTNNVQPELISLAIDHVVG